MIIKFWTALFWRGIDRNFIVLNTLMESENKYHDLRPQKKDGNISETFAFVFHYSIKHDEGSP